MGLTRHLTTPAPVLHKSADTAALTVTAALSVEVLDRAGDIVVPRGVDLRVHKADPWAGIEHYRHRGGEWVIPGAGEEHLPPVRVGVAKLPDNTYGVELKSMPGHGDVLFATTRFDPSDKLSLQTFRLVEDGTLDGTSVEIALLKGYHRPLERSPIENRYGQHIERCTLLGYAHCAVPVNQAALVCKAFTPAIEQSIRVAQTGRVGSEPAHPLILKALGRFVPAGKTTTVTSGYDAVPDAIRKAREPFHGAYPQDLCPECGCEPKGACRCRRNDRFCPNGHTWERLTDGSPALLDNPHGPVVKAYGGMTTAEAERLRRSPLPTTPVEMKAMDTTPAAMEPAYEPEPDEAPEAGGGDELSQVYDVAQQIEDLAGSLEGMAEDTASVHLIKDLPKLAAVIRAAAEKVKGAADKHQGMIDAARGGKDEPAESDEPPDMEKDDDGVLKAMAPRHYKAVKAARVKRFTKAEVAAAPAVTPDALTPPAPASPDDITPEYVAGLKKSNPKLYRTIVRELEKLSALGA